MDYIRVTIDIEESDPWSDVLMQSLADIGFESFDRSESGALQAYVSKEHFSPEGVKTCLDDIALENVQWSHEEIAQQNWNQQWESNYPMIDVDGRVLIYAGFHEPGKGFEHLIRIDPKMSFGTGHHATTKGMIRAMLELDFRGKQILDMGSGTGILAILAEKLGANNILAIEIDDWVVENAVENANLNACRKIEALHGSRVPGDKVYDVVLANINRNVLCEQIPDYATALNQGGDLLISGFHPSDMDVIGEVARGAGLDLVARNVENDWVCAHYKKP